MLYFNNTFKMVFKNKTRVGRPGDISRLDVHDWLGNLIYRIKGKTTEKIIGVAILNTVRDLYALTDEEIVNLTIELNGKTCDDKPLNPKHHASEWKKPFR